MQGNGADEASVDRSFEISDPMDFAKARPILLEAKQIFDQLDLTFYLRQGTCLGAVREHDFIPWDDDIDLGSVIGLHGLTDERIEPAMEAFRDRGFFARVEVNEDNLAVALMKSYVRIDWTCNRIVDGNIIHYPGVPIPAHLLTQLKEIEFLGDTFRVPNPPEEYLAAKYGPDWMTPKSVGYEKDILAMIPDHPYDPTQTDGEDSADAKAVRIRVLDRDGDPVGAAIVRVAGFGLFETDGQGYALIHLPEYPWHSLVITHGDHEEVLYQERLVRGSTYVYRPDPSKPAGRFIALTEE